MVEIEFHADGVTLREHIEVFGETRAEEQTIEYENCEEYELQLDTNGYVSLGRLLDVEYDDGSLESVSLRFEELPSIEAGVRPREQREGSGPPEVPHVDVDDIDVEARRNFYRRLKERPESQPATIRDLIYSEKRLTREEFDRLVEEAGYEPSGGGVSASLVVLEEVTGEIDRGGSGASATIEWTGDE